jgi:hypothetical protein
LARDWTCREASGAWARVDNRAPSRLICALILVDCFVMEVTLNGLICVGQQLAGLAPMPDWALWI